MAKTGLITGCSSGFRRILAEAVLARGDNVVATARDISSIDQTIADAETKTAQGQRTKPLAR